MKMLKQFSDLVVLKLVQLAPDFSFSLFLRKKIPFFFLLDFFKHIG